MNPILRNILAVIAGFVIGNILNGVISMVVGPNIFPLPPEIDLNDIVNSLKENGHLMEFKHFIFPFLAHALGTLAGAFIAAKIGANNKMRLAMIIGVLFLLAGIANLMMIPHPTWFAILDLVVAYIPMAWLGGLWGSR